MINHTDTNPDPSRSDPNNKATQTLATAERLTTRTKPRLVSIVVPVLNAARHLESQLAALANQDYAGDFEVVVSDNGSKDSTAAVAASWGDRLRMRVVDASEKPGAAHARNVGAAKAQGELLVFCDADDIVDHAWLESLVETASNSDLAGGSPRQDADRLPNYLDFLPYVSTNSMAVWREVFDDLDGFDTTYLRGEDIDFSWRAHLKGFRATFSPQAVIQRGKRSTMHGLIRQGYGCGYWDAKLASEYRPHGLSVNMASRALRRLLWLAVRTPYLLASRKRRWIWLRHSAYCTGALVGTFQQNDN